MSLFTEVRRHKPSVIYIPNIEAWYATLHGTIALVTFQTMLRSIPPTDPILVLATAECEKGELPKDLARDFFGFSRKNRMAIPRPQAVSDPCATPLTTPRTDFGIRKTAEGTLQRRSTTSRRSPENFPTLRIARREFWRSFRSRPRRSPSLLAKQR